LKTDVLGRVRTPPERREALLDEFEKSGMSGAQFATFIGVKYQTLANWVQKRRRRQRAAALQANGAEAAAPRWVEAVLEGEAGVRAGGALRVHLPGGAHLEIVDRRQALLAGEVLRALSSPDPRL
jgi:hypothetical protein